MSSQGAGGGSALVAVLARRRVPLGALTALAALVLARPTWTSWLLGAVVTCAGEGIRVWAAGHIEKDKEVTTSGPYRWMRHPLYVGSSVMALGIVLATRSWVVAVLAVIYMVATLTAAVTTEEARLRLAFGDAYDQYASAVPTGAVRGVARVFSLERAMRNREYRAIAGVVGGFLVLAFRVALHL